MLKEYIKFYYQALPREKQRIYKELYEGFKQRKKSIEIHANPKLISARDVGDIAVHVYNDTPSFYYLDLSKYSYIQTPTGYIYSQKYIYTDKQIESFDHRLEAGLKNFYAKYITAEMTDYQKEKVIHDYLVSSVTYDYEALNKNNYVDEAYNVLGALLKKKAVCWGIACAFKLLCDYCNIKSFVVIGNSLPSDTDAGHAWNMVKLDGKNYHVDVTWDIKDKGDISFCYDYFNLNDHLIRFDHTWESKLYPVCDSIALNYYYKNRLYVKTNEELSDFIAKALRKNDRYIAVKFAHEMPSRASVEKAIEKGFLRALRFCSYSFLISEKTHNIYIELG